MIKRIVLAVTLSAAMFGASVLQVSSAAAGPSLPAFSPRPPYAGNCLQRPLGAVYVKYDDGYIWLVCDSITVWSSPRVAAPIQVAYGLNADYYHVLGSNLVGLVPH